MPKIRKLRLVDYVLALVLIASATLKMITWWAGSELILPSLISNSTVQIVLIQVELLLSVWLIVGGFPRARWIVTSLCFCIFAGAATYETVMAMPSCGCFGNVKVPPFVTAGFDFLAVSTLYFTRRSFIASPISGPTRGRIAMGAMVAVFISALLWATYFRKFAPLAQVANSTSQIGDDLVILEPKSLLNKPFAIMDEIEGGTELRAGRWLIVLYHYDCDSCLEAIANYRAFSLFVDSKQDHLAFVAIPPFAPSGKDPVPNSDTYLHLNLKPTHDWMATTPLVVGLNDGIVVFAAQGEDAIHPHSDLFQ